MTKYSINKERVRWRVLDGEAVIIDVESSYYYSLNRTGTLIWEYLLSQNGSFQDIVEALTLQYGAGADTAESDVRGFLDVMLEENLVCCID